MKRLIIILGVLLLAVFIGVQIKHSSGYVLIATRHYLIETQLWAAFVIAVIAFLGFYFMIRGIKFFSHLPAHVKNFKQKNRKHEATKVTYDGLMDLIQANWSQAHAKLISGSRHSPAPLVNYLGAAFAFDRDTQYQKRDQLLTQAAHAFPKAKLPVNLVKAQLQYDAGEYVNALQTLNVLKELAPKQKQVLKQQARVLKKLAAWSELIDLLPEVQKQNALHLSEMQHYAKLAYHHIFEKIDNDEQLKKTWSDAPKFITSEADIVFLYVKALLKHQQFKMAEEATRNFLKKNWDVNLVLFYGEIAAENTKQQFANAEDWLSQHPHDESLLLTLGKLAQRNRLWGKSKDYYRASLAQKPTVYAYTEYAQLLEQLGEQAESLKLYRKGLLLAMDKAN